MDNYFFNDDIEISHDKVLVLIIYDISETKKRNKLVKLLTGYGRRVQKSAFECTISNSKLKKLLLQLEFFNYDSSDSTIVYKIRGRDSVSYYGFNNLEEDKSIIFI